MPIATSLIIDSLVAQFSGTLPEPLFSGIYPQSYISMSNLITLWKKGKKLIKRKMEGQELKLTMQ